MEKKSRLKDLVVVIALVTVTAGISHFVITNPLGPSRLLYYFQAPTIHWNTRCSDRAPAWMAEVQGYATRYMAAPASQLAFITPRGDRYHCETGWKDGVWGDLPLREDTRFRFASATKTVTAIAVLNLINRNALSLDDKIVDVLKLGERPKDPRVADITVDHLLSHRAGWDRVRTQDAMFMMNSKPWCPSAPGRLLETNLLYNPGETEAYSNLGYCLLGLVVEQVTGSSYRDYVSELFNFDNTTLQFVEGPYLADEVTYDFRYENFYDSNYHRSFDFQAISSSAGLSGSASDLAELVKDALSAGPITILDGDMNSTCDPTTVQECYGFGLYRYQPDASTVPLYIHGGKFPGASSVIIVTPDERVIVWLGAGVPSAGGHALQGFYDFIRESVSVGSD